MTLKAHKQGVRRGTHGTLQVPDHISDVIETLSTVKKLGSEHLTRSGHRVAGLSEPEILALNQLDDLELRSLALKYSVLRDPAEITRLQTIKGIYYVVWPLAMVEAARICAKVTIFRLLHWKLRNSSEAGEQILFLLGPQNPVSVVFDVLSPVIFAVRHGVATSLALDLIYNYPVYESRIKPSFSRRIMGFWFDQPDAIGVRNRLKMVYRMLVESMESHYGSGNRNIRVLSLACGSAQATIEAAANFTHIHPGCNLTVELVDLSEPSLKRAAVLALARGIESKVRITHGNIKHFLSTQPADSWDIVEMVGFLDYRKNASTISISREVLRAMKADAFFITATVCPSRWSFIVRWMINWPFLLRRSMDEFRELLRAAGFTSPENTYEYEPSKCFCIATCRKGAQRGASTDRYTVDCRSGKRTYGANVNAKQEI